MSLSVKIMSQSNQFLLAGDIGGTKTMLALFSPELGPYKPLEKAIFSSANYESLDEIVQSYLSGKTMEIHSASFGIAGPVEQDRVQTTNLPWVIEANALSRDLGDAPVSLLNDLQAIASAIPHLRPSDLETLNVGSPSPYGAIGVIAPGTGLGEAFLIWDGKRYRAYPSEGGHANFSPANPLELEMLNYLMPLLGHVSCERVCSGMGVPNIYNFMRDFHGLSEPGWLQEALTAAADPTPVIFKTAAESQVEICTRTVEMFIDILASEGGNLALKTLATGGIYLAGGIPPRIVSQLKASAFINTFSNKGRFEDLLVRIPVHVIVHPEVALLGAACHALDAGE
jgi:glucokinase